jgi:uncharacterized membrane protein YccC
MHIYIMIGTESYLTSSIEGDPPRTLCLKNAQKFKTERAALKRIKDVVSSHPQRQSLNYHICKGNKNLRTIKTQFGQILNTPQ